MMRAPKVRELHVLDIRCPARDCGAGPGQKCRAEYGPDGELAYLYHPERHAEHRKLVAEGWQWQEVDPRDLGANNRGEE